MASSEASSVVAPSNATALKSEVTIAVVSDKPVRDWKFWFIIVSLMIMTCLSALEFTSIGTALPVIVDTLGGKNFVWVGSAYTLGGTVLLPFTGGLSQIFGRRAVTLGSILLFSIGSAVCGAANSMNMMIIGRAVQGLGSGGLTMIIQIIIADLVSLQERGVFNGLMALTWALGGGTGPVIGGALVEAGHWRWLFYLNLPICAVAGLFVGVFLNLKSPDLPLKEKIARMDGFGNLIITCATTVILVGLTWGGADYPWGSKEVLPPLILGLLGFGAFIAYEAWFATHPIVPISLMGTVTAISGYIQNFLMSVILSGIAYWLATYYQACKGLTPTDTGIKYFGLSFSISPIALIAGLIVQRTSRYREIMWLAWVLIIIGAGLFTLLDTDTSIAIAVVLEIVVGIGIGVVYVAAYFPVLAPVPVTQNAPAIAFFVFLRNFAMVWGVTIGGAILQNQLQQKLPSEITERLPKSAHLAFSLIPAIPTLPAEIQGEVRHAFAASLRVFWIVLAGIGGVGLLSSAFMKALPLHTSVDRDWGRKEGDVNTGSQEKV